MSQQVFDFLAHRSSTPIAALKEPAPEGDELRAILQVAARVPDHGKLVPWRFIIYRGQARYDIGEFLAQRAEALEGPMPEARKDKERERFTRAPLVIGVVFSPVDTPKNIPEWEQFLSAGAATMNLCLAANALGYGSNWISNWYADDAEARAFLGLAPQERVAGFVHIGTASIERNERPRPALDDVVSDYAGPYQG